MTQNRLLIALFIFGVGFACGNVHRVPESTTAQETAFVKDVVRTAYNMGKESIVLESLDYVPAKPNPGIDKPLRVANVD